MASANMATSDVECPVCHDDLNEPKLLPCTHLVCKSCLFTWLTKQGGQGGCPMCRAPVLKSTAGNIKAQVDALPTNMAVVSLVESQKLLESPHECGVCDDNNAMSFCLHCDVKLCKPCVKNHKRIPAIKNHEIKALDKLTARQLAKRNRANCRIHSDSLAELFCPAHQELICILCDMTRHEGCTGKKMIDDAADEKRAELKQRANRMRQKEQHYNKQIQEVKDMFKAMHLSATETFDDLQKRVEDRRLQVAHDIQKQEEATMTSLKVLETLRAAYVSNARTVEHLVESASGGAILAMSSNLTSRMDEVEGQDGGHTHVDSVMLHWQQDQLSTLRDLLAQLGEVRTSTAVSQSQPNMTGASSGPVKPRGAALARVIKAGDRVKRGPDWKCYHRDEDKGGPGTLTVVHGNGDVWVRWDYGYEGRYHMGYANSYELDLL